jgi:Xaa-Pro aminopeptidase
MRINEFSPDTATLRELVRSNVHRLNALMEREEIDAIFVNSVDNWRYVTGLPIHHSVSYAFVNGAILKRGEELPHLLPLDFFAAGIRPAAPWYPIVGELPFLGTPEACQPTGVDKWPPIIAEAFRKLGLASGKIAVDPAAPWVLTAALHQLLLNAVIIDASAVLTEARMIKSAFEVDAIRKACKIADLAIENAIAAIREDITESELAGIVEETFRTQGSEFASMSPSVFSGDHPRLGYIASSDRRVKAGELVRFDIGCVVDGYCCCIARTGIVGEPDSEVLDAFAALRQSLQAGINAVRPGITNTQVHETMHDTLKAASNGKYGLDAYGGHGIGLGLHEQPLIGRATAVTQVTLAPGMVFALEPAIRIPLKGWLGLEDNVAVTANGVDLLNHAKFELLPDRSLP